MIKKQEILELAKELVTLLEDIDSHSISEIQIIVNKIVKLLGVNTNAIPSDLKKIIGISYSSALVETEISSKLSYTRSSLALLRSAVVISRGPTEQRDTIDAYIAEIEKEFANCERMGDEANFSELWKKINRSIDYMTFLLFNNGYGEIQSKGFQYTKKEPVVTTPNGGNK
jgi:hypothetical protein